MRHHFSISLEDSSMVTKTNYNSLTASLFLNSGYRYETETITDISIRTNPLRVPTLELSWACSLKPLSEPAKPLSPTNPSMTSPSTVTPSAKSFIPRRNPVSSLALTPEKYFHTLCSQQMLASHIPNWSSLPKARKIKR